MNQTHLQIFIKVGQIPINMSFDFKAYLKNNPLLEEMTEGGEFYLYHRTKIPTAKHKKIPQTITLGERENLPLKCFSSIEMTRQKTIKKSAK